MTYDIFISYASEDKDNIAKPLKESLKSMGVKVWIDEFELLVGDNLVKSIEKGLSKSRLGIVIISPSFLRRNWKKNEFDNIFSKKSDHESKIIIPVFHNIEFALIQKLFPELADKVSISTENGLNFVTQKILEVILLNLQNEYQLLEQRMKNGVKYFEEENLFDKHYLKMKAHEIKNVFIVHGHDNMAKEAVSRFIEKIGAKAIILQEQPNLGRTIIEKFESNTNVDYTIVLLTPDDLMIQNNENSEITYRARQNVIFELGYFLGKMGRKRFCILKKGKIEIPSDIYGLVYIDMDQSNGWKLSLAKELKNMEINIDLNRLVE